MDRAVRQRKVRKPAKSKDLAANAINDSGLVFTGERIVPQADNCEPNFASRMYQEHIARYLFASQIVADKAVIDIGCGVGYGSQRLGELGAASVQAFDLSEDAIRHARIHYAHPNVRYEVANAESFTIDRKFDVAVCFELIEHVRNPRAVMTNIKKALGDDGILVMSTPRALEQKRTHFHEHEFGLEEYVELIRQFFGEVEIYMENNHFSSLVTKGVPAELQKIICLKDQFDPAMADVFIAVARSSGPLPAMKPALALDNDAYVTMLERDVGILHKAEQDLRERTVAIEVLRENEGSFKDAEIKRLTDEYEALFRRSEEQAKKLWEAEQRASGAAFKDGEIERLTREYEELFKRSKEQSKKLWEAEQRASDVAFKDTEIDRLTTEYEELFIRSEKLSTKLWESDEATKHRQAEIAAARVEIERLTAECKTLRDSADDLSNQLRESEMRHAEVQQEQKKLREEIELLAVRSADADARRLEAYEFARSASQEAQGLRREIEILKRDIVNALDRPGEVGAAQEYHYDERHREIVYAMEKLFLGTEATHHITRDPIVDRIQRLSAQLNEERGRAGHLALEIQALQEFQREAEDWHRQLLRIRKSASWRLTAPLRWAARPFRAGR
jgi:2-polyprenyl-3-methyl-5-hydroxy-6-metoxy-1,4-benzoquinol methylase